MVVGLNLFWRIAAIIINYICIIIYDCFCVCNYCHSALTWEAKMHSGKRVYGPCKGTNIDLDAQEHFSTNHSLSPSNPKTFQKV